MQLTDSLHWISVGRGEYLGFSEFETGNSKGLGLSCLHTTLIHQSSSTSVVYVAGCFCLGLCNVANSV